MSCRLICLNNIDCWLVGWNVKARGDRCGVSLVGSEWRVLMRLSLVRVGEGSADVAGRNERHVVVVPVNVVDGVGVS